LELTNSSGWLDKLFPAGDPALRILDLEGNGGDAAVYFASRYPKGSHRLC
jgi:hypothetical protein